MNIITAAVALSIGYIFGMNHLHVRVIYNDDAQSEQKSIGKDRVRICSETFLSYGIPICTCVAEREMP